MDEHLSWIDHINTLENKLSKSVGLLYKSKLFLNAEAMKSLYFFFFHSYLTYGNIAWCSTSMAKFKKIFSKYIPHSKSNVQSKKIIPYQNYFGQNFK